MNFTQWKNFGYPGQELTPFEPVLARDNLVTLTNYGRLCSILFVTTPVCHCLFGFFQPLSAVPLLLAAGAAFFLRWAAQRCLNDPDQLVPRARLLTSLFTLLIFLLGVYYDLIRHPTEINVLLCLVMLIQLLLFDARPGHNLTVSLSGLAVVVLWECYVPDPHRLINIMYCFLASLIGLYLAWHKTHNMFGMLLYAQREKAAVEKETSTQAAVSQFQPHFISNMLSTIQILFDADPAGAKDALGQFAEYMRVSTDAFEFNGPIAFQRELAHVRNYAALEQLRFGGRLRVEYNIEVEDFFLPALTLQPLVENAITHGIGNRHGGGTVTIATQADTDNWRITVQDDGCGVDTVSPDGLPPPKASGITSLANVRHRVEFIAKGRLYFNSKKDRGTTVTILLPRER